MLIFKKNIVNNSNFSGKFRLIDRNFWFSIFSRGCNQSNLSTSIIMAAKVIKYFIIAR